MASGWYGGRYDEVIADLDHRPDMKLISRHPWQREDKHAEISVYRVLITMDERSRKDPKEEKTAEIARAPSRQSR